MDDDDSLSFSSQAKEISDRTSELHCQTSVLFAPGWNEPYKRKEEICPGEAMRAREKREQFLRVRGGRPQHFQRRTSRRICRCSTHHFRIDSYHRFQHRRRETWRDGLHAESSELVQRAMECCKDEILHGNKTRLKMILNVWSFLVDKEKHVLVFRAMFEMFIHTTKRTFTVQNSCTAWK